jgi:hypothetical protein
MKEEKDLLITQNVLYTRLCDCALNTLSTKSEQLDAMLDRKYTHTSCSLQRLYNTAYVTTEFKNSTLDVT